jgi:transposase
MLPPLPQPHQLLPDDLWDELRPLLRPADPRHAGGRPLLGTDGRTRVEAMLWIAATKLPWGQLPPCYGKGETVGKHFRRMAHDGAWDRVIEALGHAPPGSALRRWSMLLCRLARRAFRLRGDTLGEMARRFRLDRLWPKPPEYMPRRDVIAYLRNRGIFPWLGDMTVAEAMQTRDGWAAIRIEIKWLKKFWTLAGGKNNGRVPPEVRVCW